VACPGDLLVHGARADDLAGCDRDGLHDTAALKLARGGAGAQKLAGEIYIDDGVPLLKRHLIKKAHRAAGRRC